MPPNGTWAPPLKSNIYVSYLAVSLIFSEKNTNTQGKAPVVAVQVLDEAEKVKSGVAETREGSVKKKKYMCSSELEMSDFVGNCFCVVCETPESRLQGLPCPVCGVTVKAAFLSASLRSIIPRLFVWRLYFLRIALFEIHLGKIFFLVLMLLYIYTHQ